jgi:hypothetical protein
VQEGSRNNSGYYRIVTWGPISSAWVDTHLSEIAELIGVVESCETAV